MDAERYRRIKDLYLAASRLDDTAREAFLAQACRNDPGLRREVERLLATATVSTGDLVSPTPPAPPPPPSIGPYTVEEELGRGGMGVVYAARDESGAAVAVKIVHPHLVADERVTERLVREARLGRSVDHPAVVRTIDAGEEDGVPYLVMERVAGRTLRELGRDLGTVPERLLREIALQVAEGLAAIHAAGIVHRDLKPENVLLTQDQRIRVMDLGIAKPAAATVALTTEGQFLGSLHYAAPEQCEVGAVGPAADLYALGVVLYELATGTNPFRHESPGAVIRSHLTHVPAPAAERNPEVSAFLSDVIGALLAKDPTARFPSADALARVMREGEEGAWWTARARGPERSPALPVRRDARILGRERELAALREAWSAAQDGRGNAVLIEGETGIGKTRVLDAFLRELEDVRVVYGCFAPRGGMTALSAGIAQTLGGARLEETLARRLDRPEPLIAAFAAFLRGEAPPRSFEGDALPALFRDLLRSLAREKPVVWILDDLQFAPPQARTVAAALARAAQGEHALVLLTATPELDFAPDDGWSRLRLGRLSPRQVVDLLRDLFRSDDLADRLGGKIAHKSDGVPLFIVEMVRGLEEELVLRRRADGTFEQTRAVVDIQVPSAIREIVTGRLGGLGRDERALLDLAAVQGYEFDADTLAAILQRPLVAVLQDLAEMERRHGLVRPAGRLYRFDHHQIRDVLYAELPERLREEYHALLADAIAARHAGAHEGRGLPELAFHFVRGSRPEGGRPWLLPALEHLQRRGQPERAVELADRALARPGLLEGRARLDVVLLQVAGLEVLALRERQKAASEEAVALAEALGDPGLRSRAARAMGSYMFVLARHEEALALDEAAVRLAREAGDPALEVRALLNCGMVMQRKDRAGEAEDSFLRCLAMAVEQEDTTIEAIAAQGLALTSLARGAYAQARSAADRCRGLGIRNGNRRLEFYAHGMLGLIAHHLGEWETAREHHERYLAYAREVGDRRAEVIATGNLVFLAMALGRLADALRLSAGHDRIATEIGDRRSLAASCLNQCEMRMLLGDRVGSRQLLAGVRELGKELDDRRILGRAFALEGQMAEADDDAAGAERAFRSALEALEGIADREGVLGARFLLGRAIGDGALLRATRDEARANGDAVWELLASSQLLAAGEPAAEPPDLAVLEGRCPVPARLEARFLLWKATGNREHLAAAHRLLEEFTAGAPEAWRGPMRNEVPLHRDVARAWEEEA